MAKQGRPPGVKSKKSIFITDDMAKGILAERVPINRKTKALKLNSGVKPQDKNDYAYMALVFSSIKARWENKVEDIHPRTGLGQYMRDTPAMMFNNCAKYFEVTLDACRPLTLTGMGLFFGIHRKQIFKVLAADLAPEYYFVYEFAQFVEMYNEFAAHRKQNPAGPIFILKNLGWKDKLEIEATATEGSLTDDERRDAQKRISNFSE